ncbi:MAG: FadR/GntR family transcriptional regulator [Sedimentibacter sp.]
MSDIFKNNNENISDRFQAVKREVASDIVVKAIKKLLITKNLMPGDKLPSETELANMLNVSRGSVREAMKILTAYGIVKIKRGDGTYISDTTDGILFDPLLFKLILNNDDDIQELKELREMIELGIIKLAIENATEKNTKTLENVYNYTAIKINMGEFNDDVLIETELMFHTALGQATGNKLVQTIYNFVMDLYVPNIYKTGYKKYGEEALISHKPIIDAIKNRDLEAGEKAIKYSVDVWKNLNE